jgi:hypothetical protein
MGSGLVLCPLPVLTPTLLNVKAGKRQDLTPFTLGSHLHDPKSLSRGRLIQAIVRTNELRECRPTTGIPANSGNIGSSFDATIAAAS